jgi:hypothetical protein
MQPIIPPLTSGDHGDTASNLNSALLFLLEKGSIRIDVSPTHENPDFKALINQNIALYGDGTLLLVRIVQQQFQLPITGTVDQETADKLNALLAEQNMFNFLVNGRVIDQRGEGQSNLNVVAFDKDHDVSFGRAVTGPDGAYNISYDASRVHDFNKDFMDLVVKAFDANQRLLAVSAIRSKPAERETLDLVLQNNQTLQFRVSGHVLNKRGERLAGQKVLAYDVDLKGARIYNTVKLPEEITANVGKGFELLGQADSNQDGFYEITFDTPAFAFAEQGLADIVVYALRPGAAGNLEISGRSVMCSDSDYKDGFSVENWNIILDDAGIKEQSEYRKLTGFTEPYLQVNELSLLQIADSPDQISFLARELQQDLQKVSILLNAAVLNNDRQGNAMDQEFLYGLGRQSVKLDWLTLSTTTIDAIVILIKQSVSSNIITVVTDTPGQEDELIAKFAQLLHDFAVQKNLGDSASRPNGIRNILSTVIKDNDVQINNFYKAYVNRTSSPKEFWKNLRQDEFFKDHVDSLLMTNRLSALTSNNANVMQRLLTKVSGNSFTSLLEMTDDDWNAAIADDLPEEMPGDTPAVKQNNYRRYMQGLLFAAFPNEKVALMIRNDLTIAEQPTRDILNQFLLEVKFDLRQSRLQDKIAADVNVTFQDKLAALSGDTIQAVTNELNKIQRVFQFSPSPEIMLKILDKGIDSATMISSMPFNTFKDKYKDIADTKTLLSIHQRASHIVSMIEFAILSLNRFSQTAKIPAIAG